MADRRRGTSPSTISASPSPLLAQLALFVALSLAVLLAYAPALHGGPLWDDDAHMTAPALRTPGGLVRIWIEPGATQQYYPLVHSAFWLLHHFFGDRTIAYHLVNIELHALSAFLLALILRRLAVPGAMLAAVIFALHPVQVESVAWITELKNTLSGALYLGAALVYLRFDETRRPRTYVAAFALFTLALLTKTVTATLPAALLVIAWWRRGRVRWREDVGPLASWIAIGVAAGIMTAWMERNVLGAAGPAYALSAIERVLLAGRGVLFYLGKCLWPAHLTFIYPRWQISAGDGRQYLYPAAVAALFAIAWMLRTRSRTPLAVLLLFVGTLVPALGFVNVYPFRYSFVADHFQYLAMISVIAGVAAALATALDRQRLSRRWLPAVTAAVAGLLGILTWQQSRDYVSAQVLYETTLQRNPAATMARINLALIYLERGSAAAAVAQLEEAVRLAPANDEAWVNLGIALSKSGRPADAGAAYREAIRLNPRNAGAFNNLGAILEQTGQLQEAASIYRQASQLAPGSVEAHENLGRVLLALDQAAAALPHLTAALQLRPEKAATRYLLGMALADADRLPEAVAAFQEALRDPALAQWPEAHNDLGVALARLGRPNEAIAQFTEALRLRPDFADARANLERARANRRERLRE
jgi:Tfp pilus assembly protein PilF